VGLAILLLGYVGAPLATAGMMYIGARIARAHRRRKVRAALVGTPRMLSDGREGTAVRITGTVKALDKPMLAPLSRKPCVAYRTRAESLRQARGSPFPRGQPLDYQTVKLQPFALVRQGERDVLVEATYAELDLPPESLSLDKLREQAFFAQHGVIATGGAAHFEEMIVRDGMVVSIAGTLISELDPDAVADERGFRDEQPRRNRLVGDGPHPLLIGPKP
jgi:hypothetical protein